MEEPKYPRLSGKGVSSLHYMCNDCQKENVLDISPYISVEVRPRQLTECMYCDSKNITFIQPESHSMTGILKSGHGGHKTSDAFRDKLKQIHERTPGSRLDQMSRLTKI